MPDTGATVWKKGEREMGARQEVLARLDAGDPAGAARLAHDVLAASPENADVQGLLSLALEDAGDKAGALEALRTAVALPAEPAIALRNTANLAAMLLGAGLKDEAGGLLRSGWPWLAGVEIGANEHQCIVLLADVMTSLDLNEELVAFLLPVAERVPHQWAVVRRTAVALSAVGRHEDALALIESTVRPPAEEAERLAVLGCLYLRAGKLQKAEAAAAAFVQLAAPYVTPRKSDQWFTVGVLNPAPGGEALLAGDRNRHFGSNFPAQLLKKATSRYRFASILLGAGPQAVARFREFQARVLVNNFVNGEVLLDGRTLAAAQGLAAAVELPVVNPAQHAALTTRQMNFERFAGAPNMIVPRIKRFNMLPGRIDEIVRLAEQSFAYPLLVRTITDHDALNIAFVEGRASLREALSRLKQPQVYLIQYLGAARLKGCHRRLRAAFVEGVPVIMRADYDRHWIVQGRKRAARQEFYRSHPDLLADADDIVARPAARLGAAAMETLEAIGRAIPLDIFGLDFDVDESGRLVFFEANASMNLFSNAPTEMDYPASADALLLASIERLLHVRAETGAAPAAAAR
jgi:tetratricopeptide (TPR) repeat protein